MNREAREAAAIVSNNPSNPIDYVRREAASLGLPAIVSNKPKNPISFVHLAASSPDLPALQGLIAALQGFKG